MSTFNDLRTGLTRYVQNQPVLDADFKAILDFIQWLEDERQTTQA